MKIYGSLFSPFVRHCRIALIQGGFDWQMIEVDTDQSAAASPTQKVPYLEDGDVFLTDSVSILRYIREKSGQEFFPDLMDFELFCMTNTQLDATINLFLLEKDGLGPEQSGYLTRQQNRINTGLDALEKLASKSTPSADGQLRLACFIDWAVFRNRVDVSGYAKLKALVDNAAEVPGFIETSPHTA